MSYEGVHGRTIAFGDPLQAILPLSYSPNHGSRTNFNISLKCDHKFIKKQPKKHHLTATFQYLLLIAIHNNVFLAFFSIKKQITCYF